MPKLTTEIVLFNKNADVQKVCLDVSVNYKLVVPTEKSQPNPNNPNKMSIFAFWDIPRYRSRNGIATGDGFEIKNICSQAIKNNIDFSNNYGGGELTVKATVLKDASVTSTIKKVYIEGETISENGQNRQDAIKYLEAPAGVSNYKNILDEVGYDKFFRIISFHESARKYWQFERLKDVGYSSMSPWIGYTSDVVYPLVNKKTDGLKRTYTDGGIGSMQLTQTSKALPRWPSYLQIWNYKENINAGVKLISENLSLARNYPALVKTKGCQVTTYTDKNGKKRTKTCKPMPETPIYNNAAPFNKYEKRMDVYSLYNSFWHYWIWEEKKGWVPYKSKNQGQLAGSAYAENMDNLEDEIANILVKDF